MKKIAIMGGSFDPCHVGHIGLAEDALNQLDLDKVILVPAKIQPMKMSRYMTPPHMRMDMIRLAIENIKGLEVWDIELMRKGISYTCDTMRQIREHFSNRGEKCVLYFLSGTDAFLGMDSWHSSDELFSENNFIVGIRPGYREDELEKKIHILQRSYPCEILKVDNRRFHISSTQIREDIAKRDYMDNYISGKVEKYIRKNNLYSDNFDGIKRYFEIDDAKDCDIHERNVLAIKKFLAENLSTKRQKHTERVLELAEMLCRAYGGDEKIIEIAALTHDMCKEFPIYELNSIVKTLKLDEECIDNSNISHGKAAAEIIRRELNIDDENILNAVRYHTTGRRNMTLEEKIVFISDAAEYGRDYEGVDDIRRLMYTDIDRACMLSLKGTLESLKILGKKIHKDSIDALCYFKNITDEENI